MSAIEQGIQQKIISKGIPLKQWNISINFGIKTGFNDAFVIDTNTKNRLIEDDPKSAEIIRPILRGRDIGRYSYTFANLYVIAAEFGSHQWIEKKYPAVYQHLIKFKSQLMNRGQCQYMSNGRPNPDGEYPGQHHWLELDNNPRPKYLDDFSKQKIVWKRIGSKLRFSYDDKGLFCLDSTCFATGKHIKYLSAVLNTYIGNFLFKDSPKTGTGDLLISVQAFDPIRIPLPTPEQEDVVSGLLDKLLLNINSEYGKQLDEEINNYICTIYGFNDEEKSYIKSYDR